jgi:RNA recognition motif-containing protein
MSDREQESSSFDKKTTKGDPTFCLFVGDLSFYCTEKELRDLFSPFGSISNTRIKRGRAGDSLMHGFVEFHFEKDAKTALELLNGSKFMGRSLRYN